MHKSIAENYNVRTTHTTYHGTTLTLSVLVTNTGFKGAACERVLYGRVVYSAPNVWVALGYASPFEYSRQVFFVVEFLQVPYAPGHKDQVDFGFNLEGQEILTLTRPDQSILCVSQENQLLATHRITVRYMSERPFTQKMKDYIQVLHSSIGTIIKDWGKTPASTVSADSNTVTVDSNAGGSRTSRVPAKEVDTTHDTYQIGDPMLVPDSV